MIDKGEVTWVLLPEPNRKATVVRGTLGNRTLQMVVLDEELERSKGDPIAEAKVHVERVLRR